MHVLEYVRFRRQGKKGYHKKYAGKSYYNVVFF